jgi:hypothetical protein
MVLPLQFFHQLEGLDNEIRVFPATAHGVVYWLANALTLLPAPRFGGSPRRSHVRV